MGHEVPRGADLVGLDLGSENLVRESLQPIRGAALYIDGRGRMAPSRLALDEAD